MEQKKSEQMALALVRVRDMISLEEDPRSPKVDHDADVMGSGPLFCCPLLSGGPKILRRPGISTCVVAVANCSYAVQFRLVARRSDLARQRDQLGNESGAILNFSKGISSLSLSLSLLV